MKFPGYRMLLAWLVGVAASTGLAWADPGICFVSDADELDRVGELDQPGFLLETPPCEAESAALEAGREDAEPPAGLLGDTFHGSGGITAEYIYTGEVFNLMRGGADTRNATDYRGNFDLVVTADLDEMGFFPGGTVFLYGENGHGRGLTDRHVGDFQVYSNIDAHDFVQMSEYWWERSVWDDRITVRLGKQDATADFVVVELGGDFLQSSFGFIPTVPLPTFPDPSAAVAVFFQLTDWLQFKGGVWDGAPDGGNWGFSGTGLTLSIFEFEAEYDLCQGLPGRLMAGIWYHNDQFADVAPTPNTLPSGPSFSLIDFRSRRHPRPLPGQTDFAAGDTHAGNHGIYLGADQLIRKENPDDEEDDQGLGLFLQYGWAPEDRNQAEQYFGSGLVYKGLFYGRDEDTTGIGVAHLIFSSLLPGTDNETTIELFHKAQVTDHIAVQPDLQFIAKPSGIQRDAFLFGVRFEVVL